MKIKKIACGLPLLIPCTVAPMFMSSCSVFTDLMKEYIPKYEQLSGTLSTEQAMDEWIKKAVELPNLITDEFYWGSHLYSTEKFSRVLEPELKYRYDGEFTVYSLHMDYAKVANESQHRISYKVNAEIEEKDTYYLNDEYFGYGTVHYSCQWESQNLVYNAAKEHDDYFDKDFWLIKPKKYNQTDGWTDWLSDDEKITFNLRCVYEIYDKDGVQSYGYEATEAAVMDKNLSYSAKLGNILDYFCCLWSYYLHPCKFA